MFREMKEVNVFIPLNDNGGRPFSPHDLQCVEESMAARFRGCTLHPSLLGVWISPQGVRYRDAIMVVAVVAEDCPDLLPQLIAIGSFIRQQFNQEEVFMTIRAVGVVSVDERD